MNLKNNGFFIKFLRRYRHAFWRLIEMVTMKLKIYRSKSKNDIKLEMSHNRRDWKETLKDGTRVIVFDTETTGVDATNDYILSLSWQVLDDKLQKVDEQTRFFKNPLPDDAITGALRVNGLTKEVLEKLGTTDKKQGLEDFLDAARSCDLLVGHNVWFDITVASSECKREGLEFPDSFLSFDTMKDMRAYCLYYHTPRMRKWPKLVELTKMLDIDTTDINWHKSSSDVEATVRCFIIPKTKCSHNIKRNVIIYKTKCYF